MSGKELTKYEKLDRQSLMITAHTCQMSSKEAIEYLASRGYSITDGLYHKTIKQMTNDVRNNLYKIARNTPMYHAERIRELKIAKKELWRIYQECETVRDKLSTLKMIIELQPWLSSYIEATQRIVEDDRLLLEELKLQEATPE